MLALGVRLCLLLVLGPLQAGDRTPGGFEIDSLGQGRVRVELTGQVTVVDFFATWCPHCRESIAGYGKVLAERGDRLRVILVDVEEPPALVQAFFARHPPPAGVLVTLDPTGKVFRSFGANAYPTYFLVDDKGVVRDVSSGWGEHSADALIRRIDRLLRKPAGRGRGKQAPAPAAARGQAARDADDAHARRLGVEVLH